MSSFKDLKVTGLDPSRLVSEESRAKFDSNGVPSYFPGVTIVSHIHEGDPIYDEIIKFSFGTNRMRHIENFVQLPKSSLHMTVLDVMKYDPSPGRLSIDKLRNYDMARFIEAFSSLNSEIQQALPIKMKLDCSPDRCPQEGRPLTVSLIPWDDVAEKKVNHIRQKLCSAFEIPFQPGYKFHITLYYALWLLLEEDFKQFSDSWSKSMKNIHEAVQTVTITSLELCTFEDMFHFRPAAVVKAATTPD